MEKDPGLRKQFDEETGRWKVWTGNEYQFLEDVPAYMLTTAANYLSGQDLKNELEKTTERSKSYATLGHYDRARKLAVIADFLEAYIANGGIQHG